LLLPPPDTCHTDGRVPRWSPPPPPGITPGRGYGLNGEGYIRLSVTTPDDRLEEGMRRLEAWSAK